MVDADAAQLRLLFCLPTDFAGIGDHGIGVAVGELAEDRVVVGVFDDRGVLQLSLVEVGVGTAGVDDDPYSRLIDVGERSVFRRVRTSHRGGLAVAQVRRGEAGLLGPLQRDGDATHCQIAPAVQVLHQR